QPPTSAHRPPLFLVNDFIRQLRRATARVHPQWVWRATPCVCFGQLTFLGWCRNRLGSRRSSLCCCGPGSPSSFSAFLPTFSADRLRRLPPQPLLEAGEQHVGEDRE